MLRMLTLGIALAAATTASAANDPQEDIVIPPDGLIQQIYEDKLKAEAVSQTQGELVTSRLILGLFSVELLTLYKCSFYQEELLAGGDVFMWGPRSDTKAVRTRTLAQSKGAAMVEVNFVADGEPRKVVLSLTRFGDGWEIDDISSDRGSLRQWIAQGTPSKIAPAKREPCP